MVAFSIAKVGEPLPTRSVLPRKKKKPYVSVFVFICKPTKKVYVSYSNDTDVQIRRILVKLKRNKFSNEDMQEDFNLYGQKQFKIKIVQELIDSARIRMTVTEKLSWIATNVKSIYDGVLMFDRLFRKEKSISFYNASIKLPIYSVKDVKVREVLKREKKKRKITN